MHAARGERGVSVFPRADRDFVKLLTRVSVDGPLQTVLAADNDDVTVLPLYLGGDERACLSQIPIMHVVSRELV